MPRPLRPIADGLIYHVINRGNNRQTVFHSRETTPPFSRPSPTSRSGNRSSCTAIALWETTGYVELDIRCVM